MIREIIEKSLLSLDSDIKDELSGLIYTLRVKLWIFINCSLFAKSKIMYNFI